MNESWGKPVKRISAPRLEEIKIGGKWFVLNKKGILVLKSKFKEPQK